MDMSSDHYHTHKDVLHCACNNLIKNIYENAIVWGKFEWKSGFFTFEKTVILTHKTCLNFT